jgi:hypothetical protein
MRFSRKLEKECHRKIEVIWLMKRPVPDFKTISRFREENIGCIKPVFKEFVYLCRSLGLFGAELLGIDSSKFRAVNSKQRNFNWAKLADTLKRLGEKIERYLKEIKDNDEADDEDQHDVAEKLKVKIAKLEEKRQEYLRAQNLIKETGQREVSLTDPDSRLMKDNGKLNIYYNTEVAIDSKNKLVAKYNATNNATDRGQLYVTAEAVKGTLGVERVDVTADGGFFGAEEVKKCIDNGITP